MQVLAEHLADDKMPEKMALLTLCALAVAALLQPALAAEPSYTQVVQLKNGKVRGLVVDSGDQKKVEFFQAIRFGTSVRFEKPRPVTPWPDTYNATRQRDACPQFGNQFDVSMKNVSTSEDCLFLNLYRPVEAKANRSVMVWIHGGAFEIGSIFSIMFNGQHFAADEDVIFVSIAYRLGPIGFITGGDVPPNLGLHDQILALKWIQENIASFGGDPAKVTIFGESAGGMSVSLLVLSPLAKGLFHRAIAQSGSALSFSESLTSSFERTKKFAKKVNCTVDADLKGTMKCIKGKTPAELLPATLNDLATNDLFLPVFGDEVLPNRPKVAIEAGQVNHVDFIYGVTRDEGTIFIPIFFPELGKEGTNLTVQSAKEYINKIMTLYGKASHGKEVGDYYVDKLHNPISQNDFKLAISAVWGDLNIVCPSIIFGEELTKQLPMTSHVYAYRLMQAVPGGNFGFPTVKWIGVSHGQDIIYLFMPQLTNQTPAAHQLSHRMIEDWTTFAKVGHPENALWRESFRREANDFNTRYFHLETGHLKLVSGYFKETCEKIWKPIIFT